MPLHVPQAPACALHCVRTALATPTVTRGRRVPPAVRAAAGALRCETPLPVYVLAHLDDSGKGRCVQLVGWRFLLRAEHTVGAAEVRATDDGWAFSHFCDGPYVVSAERALRQAEQLPGGHRPRLLSVPGLYMLLLWLRDVAAADHPVDDTSPRPVAGWPAATDLLVPLAPAPPGIPAHQPCRADQLLPRLTRRLATATLATSA